ncbi:hypothetical protein BGX33_009834 [Mortierella sp. NVP41]|nr:hypothetical protein BGX33_009834 [Mortierella sp. NVP41]
MVHPGIVVASVVGVVVTGVALYTLLKEELHDMFSAFEKPSPAGGGGYDRSRDGDGGQQRDQRGGQDDNYYSGGHSSSMYQADYELRQRRTTSRFNGDGEDEEEKDFDQDLMTERFRRINETERAIAANEARLAEMERSMKEREEALQQSIREREARMEQAIREAEEQFARQDRERARLLDQRYPQQQCRQSSELYQNPFASHERLIDSDRVNDFQQQQHSTQQRAPSSPSPPPPSSTNSVLPIVAAASVAAAAAASEIEVDPRPANAILRHDLSSNHQQNVNPFEDPSGLLLENNSSSSASSSRRSSIHGDGDQHADDTFVDADDRSVTIGPEDNEDEEELDWTEAEIGSIGSHDSEDSWGSP